jgi:outer membrane biosynthesis protein TonB
MMSKLVEKIVLATFVFIFGSGFLFSNEQNRLDRLNVNIPALKQAKILASLDAELYGENSVDPALEVKAVQPKKSAMNLDNLIARSENIENFRHSVTNIAEGVEDFDLTLEDMDTGMVEDHVEVAMLGIPQLSSKTSLQKLEYALEPVETDAMHAVKEVEEKEVEQEVTAVPELPKPEKKVAKVAKPVKKVVEKVEQQKLAPPKRTVKKEVKKVTPRKKLVKKTVKKTKKIVKSSRPSWTPKSKRLAKTYRKVYARGVVSRKALREAFQYYQKNAKRERLNKSYLAVADYTKSAMKNRLHIINLNTGRVYSYKVAHGKYSGPKGGRVYRTSNRRNSYKTSKGFFKVGHKEGVTLKKRYRYLSVTGLQKANRKVGLPTRMGGRDIVLHTAKYVNSGGRSHGCFAIRPQDKKAVFSKLKGALLYSYAG